jgi:hypothetical protein
MSRRSKRVDPLAQVHDISRARLIQGLRAMHAPFDIYTTCGHQHAETDETALYVEGVGWTCGKGLVSVVCQHCCVDDHAQAEVCVDQHKHAPDRALCPTMALVEGRDAPW